MARTNTRLSWVAPSCHRCILCIILAVYSIPCCRIHIVPVAQGGTEAPSKPPLILDTWPGSGSLTADQGIGWSTALAVPVTSLVWPRLYSGHWRCSVTWKCGHLFQSGENGTQRYLERLCPYLRFLYRKCLCQELQTFVKRHGVAAVCREADILQEEQKSDKTEQDMQGANIKQLLL